MQGLMKFHQRLLKILRKQKVMDERTDGQTDGRTDNVKTVYPPTNTVCGGIISCLHLPTFRSLAVIVSEKSTVFTFSHRKTYVTKFELAVK